MADPLILADLAAHARRRKVYEATEGALRQLTEPVTTSELVKRVAVLLGCERETNQIARYIGELGPEHKQSRETGETFVKYGRTMKRREWFPAPKKSPGKDKIVLDDAELARRREVIAAHEAQDEWTIQPDFLEDTE